MQHRILGSDPDPLVAAIIEEPSPPVKAAMPLATSVAKRNRGSAHRGLSAAARPEAAPGHQPRIRP